MKVILTSGSSSSLLLGSPGFEQLPSHYPLYHRLSCPCHYGGHTDTPQEDKPSSPELFPLGVFGHSDLIVTNTDGIMGSNYSCSQDPGELGAGLTTGAKSEDALVPRVK